MNDKSRDTVRLDAPDYDGLTPPAPPRREYPMGPMGDDTPPWCHEQHDGWGCTREANHDGPHVAHAGPNREVARWDQSDPAPPQPEGELATAEHAIVGEFLKEPFGPPAPSPGRDAECRNHYDGCGCAERGAASEEGAHASCDRAYDRLEEDNAALRASLAAASGKLDALMAVHVEKVAELEDALADEKNVVAQLQRQVDVEREGYRQAEADRERIKRAVSAQAEDPGLWFIAETAPEAYLQQELRRLHAVIEGDAVAVCSDCARLREVLMAVQIAANDIATLDADTIDREAWVKQMARCVREMAREAVRG